MVNITETQIRELVKPFQMIKQSLADTPENKQYVKMVDECLTILGNASKISNPIGGSVRVEDKTKGLFQMWGLDKR